MSNGNAFLIDQMLDASIGTAPDAMPREAILDIVPRSALAAKKQIVNIVPITANTIGPNQTVQFLLPQRNLAKAHSCYLKFKLKVTKGSSATAQSFSFSGSMQSASSLINNITIQAGGMVLESLQNYHLWSNNVLSWAHQGIDELAVESLCSGTQSPYYTPVGLTLAQNANGTYAGTTVFNQEAIGYYNTATGANSSSVVLGSASQTAGAGAGIGTFGLSQFTFAAAAGSQVGAIFSIPLNVGFLNPKEAQLIPLQFINGGVLITIQTNSIAKAFANTSSDSIISTYELSEMELCYTEIAPSAEYIARMRGAMAGSDKAPGRKIKIECQSYQNYQIADATQVRQMFNVNLTSLSACLWGRVPATDDSTTRKCFQMVGPDGDANIRYEVYFDNQLMFQSPNQYNCIAHNVRQLQEALASTVGDYQVSPWTLGRGNSASGPNTFYQDAALYGISTKLFASNSCSMDGTAVGTVTINFVNSSATTTAQWYFFLVHDYIYLVDMAGVVEKAG